LGWLALLTLLPFLALAAWARVASPAPWEAGIISATALGPGLFGDVVRGLNELGNLPVWATLVAALAVVTWLARGLGPGLLIALSVASDLAAFVVKMIVERPRPDTAAAEQFFGPDSFSFPSGHVVRAVALCAALLWAFAPAHLRLRLAVAAGVVGGLVMGYARVALGVHWPTDALGALLLGLGWFAVVTWLQARLVRNA
jgi:undecaprenyl-diphosphatase